MNNLRWVSKKPKFKKDCILIIAQWMDFRNIAPYWEYTLFEIQKTDGYNDKDELAWYWGIFCEDGDEWGDVADLHADYYAIVEPRKPLSKKIAKALDAKNN